MFFFTKSPLYIKSIKINIYSVLAFVTFWCYGYVGAVSAPKIGVVFNLVLSIIFVTIFSVFVVCAKKNLSYGIIHFTISGKDILVFTAFFLLFFVFSFNFLFNSLVDDGLAHAKTSNMNGYFFIVKILPKKVIDTVGNLSCQTAITFFNVCILFVGIIAFFISRKLKWQYALLFYCCAFLIVRGIIIFFGNADVHPPFRLFPLWLSGTIFLISDFGFRLPAFLGLITIMFISFKFASKKFPFWVSFLFGVTVGSMPVLWHVGVLVEQSIWTALCWTLLLFLLHFDWFNNFKNIFIGTCLIAIFSLIRQPVIGAWIPLFMLIGISVLRKEITFKQCIIISGPIILFLPVLINAIITGTPSTNEDAEPLLSKVFYSVKSGIAFYSISNSVHLILLLFIPFAIISNPLNSIKSMIILIFFLSGLFLFNSIDRHLLGVGRYQAEYIIPFVILGIYNFITLINNFIKQSSMVVIKALFLIIIIINSYTFINLYSNNLPGDELIYKRWQLYQKKGEYSIISEIPYNYHDAYNALKADGLAGFNYTIGITYGVFSEILNGFSIKEVINAYAIVKEQNAIKETGKISSFDADAHAINNSDNIKVVLISDATDKENLIHELKDLGWRKWKDFYNEKYRTTINGLIRKDE